MNKRSPLSSLPGDFRNILCLIETYGYILPSIMLVLALVVGPYAVASNDADASKSPYQSGYDHGASDARDDCSDGCDWYILEPGKGFEFHTQEFIDGYIDGFCDNSPPGRGSDADEATFDCP